MPIPTHNDLAPWPGLSAYKVLVTPAMAQDWLDSGNIDNRYVRNQVVRRYAIMMTRGEWKATHQGVAFSDRRLIDGQHRLLAIVQSGKPQWMVVFIEQEDDVYGKIDRGAGRTLRDDLGIHNHTVDGAVWLAQTAMADPTSRSVTPEMVRKVIEVFEPSFSALQAAAASNVRGRTNASIRAAVALHHFASDNADKEYIVDMWKAWVGNYTEDWSLSISAAFRRMSSLDTLGGRNATDLRGAVAWNGFNPKSRALKKIVVKELKNDMQEMRDVILMGLGA